MQSQQTHFFESNEAIFALDVPGLVDRTEAACANLPHDEVTPGCHPFASLRGGSARSEGSGSTDESSFAALRMACRTALKPAHGKPSLQMSRNVGESLLIIQGREGGKMKDETFTKPLSDRCE